MKFAVYAAAFLPLAGALQSNYLSALSPASTQATSAGKSYVPGGSAYFPQGNKSSPPPPPPPPAAPQVGAGAYRPGGRIFYPDPANTPSNPLSTVHYDHYPGTGAVPDCTKPPQVSMLNKGTYERLNGAPGKGYLLPDPANTPSNPLSTAKYDHYPGTGAVPDCTKPPVLSTLNKGTYERLNGGPGEGYLLPDPANTPSNPLSSVQYSHYPGTGAVPDCTKPPQISVLNKGTYERLNGGPGEGYLLPDPANTPSNPLSTVHYDHYPGTGRVPDCTKPPTVSTLNKGTYEHLNGYQNPVSINRENPFSRGF
jgi:hypothetical protein